MMIIGSIGLEERVIQIQYPEIIFILQNFLIGYRFLISGLDIFLREEILIIQITLVDCP